MENWAEDLEGTEPQSASGDGRNRRWLAPTLALGGLGVGAGLMYVLDPDMGRYRRALARDRVATTAQRVGGATATAARSVGDRALDAWSGSTRVFRRGHTKGSVVDQLTRVEEAMEEGLRRAPGEWTAGRRTPTARVLAGVTGGTLAVLGVRRRGVAGATLGVASMFLLAQALRASGGQDSGGEGGSRVAEGVGAQED